MIETGKFSTDKLIMVICLYSINAYELIIADLEIERT